MWRVCMSVCVWGGGMRWEGRVGAQPPMYAAGEFRGMRMSPAGGLLDRPSAYYAASMPFHPIPLHPNPPLQARSRWRSR